MATRVFCASLKGIESQMIRVEIDSTPGIHTFTIVGLGDKAVQESIQRIDSAIKHSGFSPPRSKNKRFIVNLAPADTKKEGPGYDAAIAIAFLVETKQCRDAVADTLINSMAIKELAKIFPNDIVIGEEESTGDYGMGRRWFCDPIDGTKAYTWGTPTAMFSIGLIVDGRPVMGVTYDPFLNRMYWATKGQGAFCNDVPLHVSNLSLKEGMLAISSSAKEIRYDMPYLDTVITQGIQTASFSGAVYKMTLVARGRMAGYVEGKVNAHDTAASHIIITEAGGKVTDLHGNEYDYSKPFRGTIVSNGITHDELVKIVNGAV
jgi:fructose-1,6-bisphosphatase/inositol monophosphatase family enzyme